MSFFSQNIDNNQRLAAAAARSMGHGADDANYMASTMGSPLLPRDNSLQNAWARDMSLGQYGYDDQSTQNYLQQARQFGIDPPSRQTMDIYQQKMYGQGRRNNRKSQKKRKSRKSRKSRKPRKSRNGGAQKSRKARKSRKSRKSRKLRKS